MYDCQDTDTTTNNNDDLDDLNLTERSEFDDDDKILFTKIGTSEIPIDKVLSNLLVVEEYATFRNIIMKDNDDETDAVLYESDDLFSNHSLKNLIGTDIKQFVHTKGKLYLTFSA